jgi:hypothetical protein
MLTPVEQYQNEIIFNTPGIRGGYGFTRNYINVVYMSDSTGAIPYDLELGEVMPTGLVEWTKVSDISGAPGSQFKDPDLIGSLSQYFNKITKLPYDGVYRLRCNSQKIAAYAYGFADWDSYGFPTGSLFMDKEKSLYEELKIVINKPGLQDDTEPTMGTGFITGKAIKDSNIIGNIALAYLHPEFSDNIQVEFDEIPGEDTTSVNFTYTIIDKYYDAKGVIVVADKLGNVAFERISYKGAPYDKTISITKPVEGDVLKHSGILNLTWVCNFNENVNIQLFQNGNLLRNYAEYVKNNRSYTIELNEVDFPIGKNYQLKVIATSDSSVFAISGNFEVKEIDEALEITKPDKEISAYKNIDVQIEWTKNKQFPVKIELIKEDKPIKQLTSNYTQNSYNWQITNEVNWGDVYQIKVISENTPSVFDITPNITIIQKDPEKKITFLNPIKGVVFEKNKLATIKWFSNYKPVLDVDLLFKGKYALNITSNTTQDSINWTIPEFIEQSNDYQIKITDVNNPNVNFTSDMFTIGNGASVEDDKYADGFSLSPNPAEKEISINFINNELIYSYEIYDIKGSKILSNSGIMQSNLVIDISKLPINNYIINLKTDKGNYSRQFKVMR